MSQPSENIKEGGAVLYCETRLILHSVLVIDIGLGLCGVSILVRL
jgi:hypothetical protein